MSSPVERRPLIIVGSGPAGSATALALQRRDPTLAREMVVLEKTAHPRSKVCAGGLIPSAVKWLDQHDVDFDVPHVPIHRARARTPSTTVDFCQRNFGYVIRRNEFDARLVDACRERDIEIRQNEAVREVRREGAEVVVETEHGAYRAPQVVAADGSGSILRRRLLGEEKKTIARATMCDVPVREAEQGGACWDGFGASRYDFDFSDVPDGLSGYAWSFPCLIGGRPHVNVGVYSLRADGGQIRRSFEKQIAHHCLEVPRRVAFPIRWYRRGKTRVSAQSLLLTGDAAGADPLMGEGISLALEYGSFAAAAALEAQRSHDYSGERYQKAIDQSWLGLKLGRLHTTARWFYSRYWKYCFMLPERSLRLRTLGLRWYNGIDDWDRRSVLDAAVSLCRADFASAGAMESPLGAEE